MVTTLEWLVLICGWCFVCFVPVFMVIALPILGWLGNKRQQKIIDREFQQWVQYDDYMFSRELAQKTALAKIDIMNRQARRAFVQELKYGSKKRKRRLLRDLARPD